MKSTLKRWLAIASAICLFLSASPSLTAAEKQTGDVASLPASTVDAALASPPSGAANAAALLQLGVTISSNAKAAIDASNLEEGYVSVKYTGGKKVAIKVQIKKDRGVTYTYNLNNAGSFETFPLSEGDGKYTIRVFENITGTKYATAHTHTLTLKLRSPFLPFLYPNQYVNYTSKSAVVKKAAELTANDATDLDKIESVYHYVIKNVAYDYDLADSLQSGYLPNLETLMQTKKGICFDYAAIMAAMLRSQNIPSKLVVGYVGTVYHAWINVYVTDIGWVDKAIYFNGKSWSLMDPTFVSTANNSAQIRKYVSNADNYSAKYAY